MHNMRSREEYQEFHERDYDTWEVADEREPDNDSDCPDCKHDEYCGGGCRSGRQTKYKFETLEAIA